MNFLTALRDENNSFDEKSSGGSVSCEEERSVMETRDENEETVNHNPVESRENADLLVNDVVTRHSQPGILRNLPEKYANTRAIVIYHDKHDYLNKKLRNRLSRFIIGKEKNSQMRRLDVNKLMPTFNITRDQFIYFAKEICKTFPREHPHTYYSPYCRDEDVVVPASGKLWWHFDYIKKVLFEDEILSNRGNKTNLIESNIEIPASSHAKLEALRAMLSLRTTVIQLWNETFDARRNDLMKNKITVRAYLDKYLCLRMKDALILFQKDFARLHKESVRRLRKFWRVFEDHLIEKIKVLKIKESSYSEAIRRLSSSNPDEKTGIVLSLLPYLIAPRRLGKKRKSLETESEEALFPRKLSFEERIESFFVYIPDVVDLETVLETGINHTTRFSLQHQPVPIIVGPFGNIAACYVILEDVIYGANSLLHAFESTIEICYAVNCDYPQNARTLWIFLQQAYLSIAHASDKPSVDLTSIIGEVQNIIHLSDLQNQNQ